MRKQTEGLYQMAALPWLRTNSLESRELGINLTEFNTDMLDWRNNKWIDNPSRPASNWRQYLLIYHYTPNADSAQGTEWLIHRTIPTLEFLRFDGGIYTLGSDGNINLNNGTGFSGAKTIGYNPFNLISHSITSVKDGILIDNVQDALDAVSKRLAMMGGGIRNVMDIEKSETNNNMQLCGTITTAIWRSPSVQEWASKFYMPWYPRNSAIFGSDHDIFRGDSLLVSGKGNLINNDSKTETSRSLIMGLENKVLHDKKHVDNEIKYNLTNSILSGRHNETMNSVSDSIIGGYENSVGDVAPPPPSGFSITVAGGTASKPAAKENEIVTIAADGYYTSEVPYAEEEEKEEEDGETLGISGLLVAGGKNRVSNAGHSIVTGYKNLLTDASDYSAIFGAKNGIYDKSTASFIAGIGNRITESGVHSSIFGSGNGIYNSSTASFIAGAGNQIANGSVHSVAFGAGNGLYNGSTASFVAGTGNRVTDGSVHSAAFGSGNGIHNHSTASFLAGTGNLIATGSVHSVAFGAGNKITEMSSQSFAAGGGNLVTYSEASAVFGRDNIISHSDFSFMAGGNNKIEESPQSVIFGTANCIYNHSYESFVAGWNNMIDGESWHSAILGGNNLIYGAHEAFIMGRENQIDNGYHSVVFGQGNVLKNALDSLAVGRGHNILSGECITVLGSYHNIPEDAQVSNVAILGGSGLTPIASNFAVTDRLSINSRLLLLGDGTYDNPSINDFLMVEGLETVTGIDGNPKSVPKVKWGKLSAGTGISIGSSGTGLAITNTKPNVKSDWNAEPGSEGEILNKPGSGGSGDGDSMRLVKGDFSLTQGFADFIYEADGIYSELPMPESSKGFLVMLSADKLAAVVIGALDCPDKHIEYAIGYRTKVGDKFNWPCNSDYPWISLANESDFGAAMEYTRDLFNNAMAATAAWSTYNLLSVSSITSYSTIKYSYTKKLCILNIDIQFSSYLNINSNLINIQRIYFGQDQSPYPSRIIYGTIVSENGQISYVYIDPNASSQTKYFLKAGTALAAGKWKGQIIWDME